MKVVVTGGAGFIGANLCATLLESGVDQVTVLDDFSTGRKDNLVGLDVALIEGDICAPDVVDAALDGAQAVVHLAALGSVPASIDDPVASHHTNTTGTLRVLEGARRAGHIHTIVASSSAVYGATETLPTHEDLPTRPMSPYGATKLATEWYALAYQHSMNLPVLAFRFFNVFGPLQPADHVYAAVIPRFVDAALHDRPLTIYGDGLQSRDFTYVDTVCTTIARAVHEQVTDPEPVNLAFGTSRTLLDVVAELESVLGHRLAVDHQEPRVGDIRHSDADPSRVHRLFPDLDITPLRTGLEATVDWFRSS